jgi:hypothetical protein
MPTKNPKQTQHQEAGWFKILKKLLTAKNPKQTQHQEAEEQAGYPQESPPIPQQAFIDVFINLIQEATKQFQQAPPLPTLVGGALEAATEYENIKTALMTTPRKAI